MQQTNRVSTLFEQQRSNCSEVKHKIIIFTFFCYPYVLIRLIKKIHSKLKREKGENESHLQNLWFKGRELVLHTLIFNGAMQQKNMRIGNLLLHLLVSNVLGEHQAMDQ